MWFVDRYGGPGHDGEIMRPAISIVTVALMGTWPVQAFACTLCHSEQAASVRARLLQSDIWLNACTVVLPLAMLAWIIALVVSGPAGRGCAK